MHVFRWDLDKTYLRTDFDTVRDLVKTARLSAEERENIPGSAALMRGIRENRPDGRQHLVYFISGSPRQLRRVIERKFSIDGFSPDGFVLKASVSDFFRGRFRAMRNHLAFKLGALLAGRADVPVGSRETLLGDDAESDAFIYSLYADVVGGAVSREELRRILVRSGAYPDQLDSVEGALEAIVHERAVERIVIHLDQLTPPAAFLEYFPRVVPIYNHLQTAIVLGLDGTLLPVTIREVVAELLGGFGFEPDRLLNSAEDILRRRRPHTPPEALLRLSAELRGLPEPSKTENGLAKELVADIAERIDHLCSRPLPRTASLPPIRPRNYEALFDEEEARRDEARRIKKAAPRVVRAFGAAPE